jgi:hypothetical protein
MILTVQISLRGSPGGRVEEKSLRMPKRMDGGIFNDDFFVIKMKCRESQAWRVQHDSHHNDREPSPFRYKRIHLTNISRERPFDSSRIED